MEDTQEHKKRIDFNDKSYEWGDIKNESEYERYAEELEKCYRRYCPLGKDLQSNIKRFPELRKTLDALREKKDDNKDYNKTPEYLEAKAGVLKYHLEFTNNPHLVAIDEEHSYLQKKLKYIVQKMRAWDEASK